MIELSVLNSTNENSKMENATVLQVTKNYITN